MRIMGLQFYIKIPEVESAYYMRFTYDDTSFTTRVDDAHRKYEKQIREYEG